MKSTWWDTTWHQFASREGAPCRKQAPQLQQALVRLTAAQRSGSWVSGLQKLGEVMSASGPLSCWVCTCSVVHVFVLEHLIYYCEQRKDGCKHARICRVSRDTYRQTLTAARLGNREKREGRACALEKQGAPLGKLSKGQLWKERRFEERMDHIWGGGVSLLFEEIKFLRSLYKRSLQNVKFTWKSMYL